MKQQLLIVFTGPLELGGIERSLLGLLDSIDYDRYNVDLFLYSHHGAMFHAINPKVNLLPEVKELAYLRESFFRKIKKGCLDSAIMRLKDGLLGRFSTIDHDATWAQIMRKHASPIEKQYDLAIGFFRPFDFIIDKVHAKRKVGWIHTDYRSAGEKLDAVRRDFERLDSIAAVSDQVAESFCELFPQLNDKVTVIENILSPQMIRQQADTADIREEMAGTTKLLSIGRFTNQKNFDNIPDICKRIREKGIDINWYLIGFGPDESFIRHRVEEAGMQEHVIILGKKDNPYPYIKACDLYVQPSRYEGKCVAVREAQMLGKPVVITNYGTSGSQLEDGVDGIIVPIDNAGCAAGIAVLLRNPEKMESLKEACLLRDYSNSKEIDKVYQLIKK